MRRLPAGVKLISLSAAVLAVAWIQSLPWLTAAAILTAMLFTLARPTRVEAWQQVRPILVISGLAFAFNVWFLSWQQALLISGRVGIALTLAAVFTLTTPVSDVLNTVDGMLRRTVGPDRAERFGLLIALTIRSIPQLAELVSEVQQARRARGLDRSLRAFAVPVMVRALTAADDLGDALTARGVTD